jgi:hypothetical protein
MTVTQYINQWVDVRFLHIKKLVLEVGISGFHEVQKRTMNFPCIIVDPISNKPQNAKTK